MLAAEGHTDGVLEVLLERGADPETRDKQGVTALYHAARGQRIERVQALLNRGVNVWARDRKGRTAGMMARDEKLMEIAKLLRRAEAQQKCPAEDAVALLPITLEPHEAVEIFAAAQHGFVRVLRRCIEAGAPIDGRSPAGATPLMFAAAGGHAESVALLLERGASAFARDDRGSTALDWAERQGRAEVRALLEAAMGIVHRDIYTGAPEGFW